MTHSIREQNKPLNRVRRIRGQVDAIQRALEGEASCAQVMHRITASRGAINGLLSDVVEDHLRSHLIDRSAHRDALDADAVDQLVEIVRSCVK